MILFKMSSVSEKPVLCLLFKRYCQQGMEWNGSECSYQVPGQRNRNGQVTDRSADEPDDHDCLELLEVHELRDVVDVDGCANASNCKEIAKELCQ